MATPIPIETTEYRIVIVDPRTREICVPASGNQHRLISLVVPKNARPARHLQKSLRVQWGVSVLILDILSANGRSSPCAVAELLDCHVTAGLAVVTRQQLADGELSEEEHVLVEAILVGNAKKPFAGIGWIDEAILWLEASTGGRVPSKTDIDQYNASGAFALIRFPIEDGNHLWLKATGAPQEHERLITSLLSKLCRGSVPEVVAERSAWNAWLMRDEGDESLEMLTEASDIAQLLEGAVQSLAELQIRTVGAERVLLDVGAADHRTCVLQSKADMLFTYIDEAMGFQTSTRVLRVEANRLHEIQSIFENVCDEMDHLCLPDTVLHGDMNFGNILFRGGHCVFADWCEAYVGNPFVTFEHLRLLNSIADPSSKATCDRRLRETYREAMSSICDPRAIDAGLAYVPLIAAVSAILGRGDWLQTSLRSDPRRQAYARAVARHMDRAASDPMLLEALPV